MEAMSHDFELCIISLKGYNFTGSSRVTSSEGPLQIASSLESHTQFV